MIHVSSFHSTRNFNPDQRHITLEFTREKGDVILAQVPPEPAVVIVGYYLVFVIDSTGRPSTGRFLQICMGHSRPPRPWFDPDWWEWLRELLRDGRKLTPEELRKIRREALGPPEPPWRRPMSTEGHGHGDQGGHDQGGHDHGGHDHGGHDHGGGHPGENEPGGGDVGHDHDHTVMGPKKTQSPKKTGAKPRKSRK